MRRKKRPSGTLFFRRFLVFLCLVVAGMQAEGSFLVLSQRLLTGKKSMRLLTMTLVMLPFFSSMLITNDVSLITFVPFAVLVLELTGQSHRLAWVVTLQSIAANIGSMLTPVGNPQNLYLSSYYQIPTGSFFAVTVPVVALSFVLLAACCMAEKKQVIEVHFDRREKIHSKARLTLFAVLFLVSLLAVLHVISSHTALGITVALMLLCARDVLKKVDYWLLATFVCCGAVQPDHQQRAGSGAALQLHHRRQRDAAGHQHRRTGDAGGVAGKFDFL